MRKLYTITFPASYAGPAEVRVRLPNGGAKAFNRDQADPLAKDYPLHTCPMTSQQAAELAKHGFAVSEAKGLEEMKAKELRAIAEREGVDLAGATKKEAIIAAIRLKRSPLSKIQVP